MGAGKMIFRGGGAYDDSRGVQKRFPNYFLYINDLFRLRECLYKRSFCRTVASFDSGGVLTGTKSKPQTNLCNKFGKGMKNKQFLATLLVRRRQKLRFCEIFGALQ